MEDIVDKRLDVRNESKVLKLGKLFMTGQQNVTGCYT